MQALDADAVSRWADTCVADLEANREEIDRINVYPVADADTGSNLLHTMRSALDSLRRAPAEVTSAVGGAISALAKGALTGARGNSGVILSQVLRGLAETVQGASSFTGVALRAALSRADELATAAVARPVPGTVLSVLHAAAQAAGETESDSLPVVAAAALDAAERALDRTPDQLAVLARAGVVDAGGRGLVVLLEALSSVVGGGSDRDTGTRAATGGTAGGPAAEPPSATAAGEVAGASGPAYEVMYLLSDTDADRADELRGILDELGDSVSVAGDGAGLWSVHVHCDDIGFAIEAGVQRGRPHDIRVLRFADAASPSEGPSPTGPRQADPTQADPTAVGAPADQLRSCSPPIKSPAAPSNLRAVVAMAGSAPLAELLSEEGASVLQPDPEPGTDRMAELLAVIRDTRARHVCLLPDGPASLDIAEQAAGLARDGGQDVVVVPVLSPVQGLAALAVHDPRRRPAADCVAMAEAAAATRRGEVVIADNTALTWVGRCEPGDALGLIDGEVVIIGADPIRTASDLLDRMLSVGGELVTILLGADAPDGLLTALSERLRRAHPEVDLTSFDGELPATVLLLGVE